MHAFLSSHESKCDARRERVGIENIDAEEGKNERQ